MIIFIPSDHGKGHIFRSLNIANQLKSYTNEKIGFYINYSFEDNNKNQFLNCDDNDLKEARLIVIDSNDREFNRNALSKVNYENVIWITDLQEDLSGNYKKIFAPFSDYSNDRLISGLDYFVVQADETENHRKASKFVNSIGIYFGSVDETNNLFYVLHKLDKLGLIGSYNFNIMIGTRYKYENYIDEYFIKGYPSTIKTFKSNFKSIYDFLNLNDLFIGCCGNTSFEALHVGLPIINIVQNHLQNTNAGFLQKEYGFPNLGFYPSDNKILELFKSEIFNNLSFYSKLAKTVIDGKGSDRISTLILEEM